MWKPSKTFPNIEVSNGGKLRTWHGGWCRYVEKKPREDKDGYEIISTRYPDGRTTTARVHRLVAEAYIPNKENKPVVNHLNGVKNDNRVYNLRWSTVAENTQHGYDELGVVSAMSIPVLLCIDGVPYSTYQSISYMSEMIGINRNNYKDIQEKSNRYFTIHENFIVDDDLPYNMEVWRGDFRTSSLGKFYFFDGGYYDKVLEVSREAGKEVSTIYRWLIEGHPKGVEIREVSCEEYLRNTPHRNW